MEFRLFRHQETGEVGERLAAEWLVRELGFSIVTRNWRSLRDKRLEIDIVAQDGRTLVFVEVKTRDAGALVGGHHSVDRRKQSALRRAVLAYLACLRTKPLSVRVDVIEVSLPADRRSPPEIRHYANLALFGRYWHP